jgi:hypothetical protein
VNPAFLIGSSIRHREMVSICDYQIPSFGTMEFGFSPPRPTKGSALLDYAQAGFD